MVQVLVPGLRAESAASSSANPPGVGSGASARLWTSPPATAVNVPVGTSIWPSLLLPHPASVPSLRIARLWEEPAATAVNVPVGTSVWPLSFLPHPASVPSLWIACLNYKG